MAEPRDPLQPKAMKFFWRSDWRERLDWYESHFSVPAEVRGEATPAYSAYPVLPDVPRRIASVIPDAKLIYLVRDPIERILSQYAQVRSDGDRRTLDEHLRDWDEPTNLLVCSSRYATQLHQYLDFFALDQILVVDQHDLAVRRRDVMREVFSFLDVDAEFYSSAYGLEHNQRSNKTELTPLGRVAWERVLHPALRRLPASWSEPIGRPVRQALSRPLPGEPVMSNEMRRMLEQHLGLEVKMLRELTNKPFASWSV